MADIEAHITGTVFKIHKKVGDQVKKHEEVLLLESMKMEIPVESPVDGTITEIRFQKGDNVNEGTVIVVVE
ncbi:acetyl-CoA carboxylase biotin carboxyl carrier protein subunit [Candidatus Entotheonella palauensis]|uniref:Lipoyl-binding domain-containing protein n=1 Tax=Candidatus Entotheonella gemina TaxID=1429439 RepID=W4MGJ2_9BACT|nr:acetyl-CoA carboxylase biotin carboxyl carrier protein subunit [Candidatus Entotheonella palauensis]ETX09061.1 MAG: hypothetical protein ETSY2_01755 [Candidatus Entotheonella gemina]